MIRFALIFSAFMNNPNGLERTLRFLQACSAIAATKASPQFVTRFLVARSRLNLVRRFFRLFKWIDCWTAVFNGEGVGNAPMNNLWQLLHSVKHLSLGSYFFLDMLVILHAMDVYQSFWALDVEQYALACWLHSICISIMISLMSITFTGGVNEQRYAIDVKRTTRITEKKGDSTKNTEPEAPASGSRPPLPSKAEHSNGKSFSLQELLTNCCDIFIPAQALGYIQVNPIIVSAAMATSSLITMASIWNNISSKQK